METVSQISKKLRSGKIDAVDLTEQVLEDIKNNADQNFKRKIYPRTVRNWQPGRCTT